jgi:hypothetical protein
MTVQEFDSKVAELRGKVEPKQPSSRLKKHDCTPEEWAARLDWQARYRAGNPDQIKQYGRLAYAKDPTKGRSKTKRWRQANPQKHVQHNVAYMARRSKKDPAYKLSIRLRTRLCNALRAVLSGGSVSSGRAVRLCGLTMPELVRYIESLWQPGMSWDNYGNRKGCWNVDHVFPMKGKGIDLLNGPHVAAVCNYRNLRPVWHSVNVVKSNEVTPEAQALFDELLEESRAKSA